jgi:hypothetical protein
VEEHARPGRLEGKKLSCESSSGRLAGRIKAPQINADEHLIRSTGR